MNRLLTRTKLSPSLVIALMALVAAITGVAVAAPSSSQQRRAVAHAASTPRGPRGFRGRRGFRGFPGPRGSAGIVPQIKLVDSPHETLNPGQNTFNVDPNNFQATCPGGYTVIGTGFDADIGKATEVLNFGGFFVGGFIINDTSIQLTNVHVQAMCGVIPGGASVASARGSRIAEEAAYHAMLVRAAR